MHFRERQEKARAALSAAGIDMLFVSQIENVAYLTGLRGHADFDFALLLTQDCTCVFTNALYAEAAEPVCEGQGARLYAAYLWSDIAVAVGEEAVKIGFEARHVPYAFYTRLQEQLPAAELVPVRDAIERLRVCKDGDELAVLRRACRLTDEALERLLPEVRPGVRESDLARALRRIVEDLGGDGLSFDPIVAFGEHTSRPHHTPTDRALRIGELIQFDIGVRLGGYGADLSRVAVVGKLSDPHRRLVDALVAAQQQALDAVYAGMDGRTLDTETKQAIERAGFPAYPHGLGHGIGLDAHVHEAPTLSVRYPDAQPLEEGMVFTVEPGVYLAGDAGARIEDVVAIVDGKPEILSEFPRALIELPA